MDRKSFLTASDVWHWHCLRERRAGASSHKFPTPSPGCATLFAFVVYNRSELCAAVVSDSPAVAVKPPILGDACIRVRIKYFYSFMTFGPY